MKIDIRFDENMNRPKYFVTKKKPNKKIEIFEIRTEATKQLDNCEKATSFRDSIKVKNVDTNKYISIHENKTDINKEFLELSL